MNANEIRNISNPTILSITDFSIASWATVVLWGGYFYSTYSHLAYSSFIITSIW